MDNDPDTESLLLDYEKWMLLNKGLSHEVWLGKNLNEYQGNTDVEGRIYTVYRVMEVRLMTSNQDQNRVTVNVGGNLVNSGSIGGELNGIANSTEIEQIVVGGESQPLPTVSRDKSAHFQWWACLAVGILAAIVAASWFIDFLEKWRPLITAIVCSFIFGFAITAWMFGRMATWEKRMYFSIALLVILDLCFRFIPIKAGGGAKNEHFNYWFIVETGVQDPPSVVISKIVFVGLLLLMAFFSGSSILKSNQTI